MNTKLQILGVIGVVILAAGGGALAVTGTNDDTDTTTTPTPQTVENVPQDIKEVKPLAAGFYNETQQYYPESRVYLSPDARIMFEFSPDADSGEGVRREMSQVATLYPDVINRTDANATSLSIITGEVEMVVPYYAAEKRANGNLTQEAYMETIEVKSIERDDD